MSSSSIEIHTECSEMMRRGEKHADSLRRRRSKAVSILQSEASLSRYKLLAISGVDLRCAEFKCLTVERMAVHTCTHIQHTRYARSCILYTVNSKCPNTFLRFLTYIFTGLNNALHVRNIHFNYFLLFKTPAHPVMLEGAV